MLNKTKEKKTHRYRRNRPDNPYNVLKFHGISSNRSKYSPQVEDQKHEDKFLAGN